jgi:hypothetical protein
LVVLFFQASQGTQNPLQTVAVAVLEFGFAGADTEQPMGDVAEHDGGSDRAEQDELQGCRVEVAIELTAFLSASVLASGGPCPAPASPRQASSRIGRGSVNASCR